DDRDVLDAVVSVDVDVARRVDPEVDERVLGQRDEHVVVEAHAGRDLGLAGAVEVEGEVDLRLTGGAAEAGPAVPRGIRHALAPSACSYCCRWESGRSAIARRNAEVSSGVPAVTRRWCGMPTSRTSTPRSSSDCQVACASASPAKRTKLA